MVSKCQRVALNTTKVITAETLRLYPPVYVATFPILSMARVK